MSWERIGNHIGIRIKNRIAHLNAIEVFDAMSEIFFSSFSKNAIVKLYSDAEKIYLDVSVDNVHVETVVQLVRKKPDTYIDITVDMDELDLTSYEAKATYDEIKNYIFDKHCVKVSSLYIAQVKQNTVLSKEIVTTIPKKITQSSLNARRKKQS